MSDEYDSDGSNNNTTYQTPRSSKKVDQVSALEDSMQVFIKQVLQLVEIQKLSLSPLHKVAKIDKGKQPAQTNQSGIDPTTSSVKGPLTEQAEQATQEAATKTLQMLFLNFLFFLF